MYSHIVFWFIFVFDLFFPILGFFILILLWITIIYGRFRDCICLVWLRFSLRYYQCYLYAKRKTFPIDHFSLFVAVIKTSRFPSEVQSRLAERYDPAFACYKLGIAYLGNDF